MWVRIAWVGVCPKPQNLLFFFEIASDLPMIERDDEESLAVAGVVAEFIGFGRALAGEHRLAHLAVLQSQMRVGKRKLRIEFHGPLKQGKSCRIATRQIGAHAGAVGFQRVE